MVEGSALAQIYVEYLGRVPGAGELESRVLGGIDGATLRVELMLCDEGRACERARLVRVEACASAAEYAAMRAVVTVTQQNGEILRLTRRVRVLEQALARICSASLPIDSGADPGGNQQIAGRVGTLALGFDGATDTIALTEFGRVLKTW